MRNSSKGWKVDGEGWDSELLIGSAWNQVIKSCLDYQQPPKINHLKNCITDIWKSQLDPLSISPILLI